MANVLDSLVIKFALDTKNVPAELNAMTKAFKTLDNAADAAGSTLEETGENAENSGKKAEGAGKKLEQSSKKAEKSGKEFERSGKKSADSFSLVRREALGLLAIFTGGKALKDFLSDVTRSNSELGYMAQRLNMDPTKLYQMQKAVEAVGGSASEVGSTFQTLQNMAVDPAQSANLNRIMGNLGLNTNDYLDEHHHIRQDILKRLNRSTQGMDQGVKNTLLSSLGFGPGEINLIDKSVKDFDRIQKEFQNIGPTEKQIKDSQRLTEEFTVLTTQSELLGRTILGDLTPSLEKGIDRLIKWEQFANNATQSVNNFKKSIGDLGEAIKNYLSHDDPSIDAGYEAFKKHIGSPIENWLLNKTSNPNTQSQVMWLFDDNTKLNPFSNSIAGIEGARYDQMGGAGGKFAGKYQMGEAAIKSAANFLHEKVPTTDEFLHDPAMQERYFQAFTAQNDQYLSSHSDKFRNASAAEKLSILAYAHNQGAGGALQWLNTGVAGSDAFGTSGTKYAQRVLDAFKANPTFAADKIVSQYETATTAAQAEKSSRVDNSTAVHIGNINVHTTGNNGRDIARDIHAELARSIPNNNARSIH
ncbi:hypothetical protein [Swingsia samuiensis]|uniref:Uncharacterized protein n=1 Tax=Swingsia samuiensis TaxID=1293412 RepID=A0A4Y6ULY7_9PROT|nr:hypothetical protein [Swingsia samuiensis]QDH17406.1 hypothetical protein E3D00_07385 [Swingsia samuiensis]